MSQLRTMPTAHHRSAELLFSPLPDEWVYVKDTGKIFTFSLCYVSWDVAATKTGRRSLP